MRAGPALLVMIALGVAVVATSVVVGAAPAPARVPATSDVVYPAQTRPLRFAHAVHAAVACVDCHVAARTSQSAVDRLLPAESVCARCHPIDRAVLDRAVVGAPAAACVACHPGFVPGQPVRHVDVPTPNLKFSHATHLATACVACHGDMAAPAPAGRGHLPTMASCMTCHDGVVADAACGACHPTEIGGRLQTRFADGVLAPGARSDGAAGAAHDADFLRRHGAVARGGDGACAACHEERECTDCHVGAAPMRGFHTPDYERNHAAEARRGTPDCAACHRAQSFCVGCHERVGLGTRAGSEFVAGDPLRAFHPPGWASTGIAAPNLHAAEARRNLPSCASCHREDDCLACHGAVPGGVRASPHPRGWRGSAQCEAMDQKNRRMCLRCHVTADELGCDWTGLEPTP